MRLLAAIAEMGVGGAERVVVESLRSVAEHGDEAALLAATGPLDADLAGLPLQRWLLPQGRTKRALLGSAAAARRAVASFRPDIVHAHNVRVAAITRLGIQAARPLGRPPLLVTYHGVPETETKTAARLLRVADAIVCVSAGLEAQLAANGVPSERLSVIPNGVPDASPLDPARAASLRAELGIAAEAPLVAVVGRLVPQKAHDRFLGAAARVVAAVPEARFLVIGDGPLRAESEALSAKLDLTDAVTFTGLRSDATDLIGISDLLVFSSVWEGLSIAALEALARGVPVVSTEVDGSAELLGSGAGVVVAQDDIALADGIIVALADPVARQRMGAEGRLLHAERFSTARMMQRYRAVYAALGAAG
jgi:glycosyltransferase involved in cell wall biosynthesis